MLVLGRVVRAGLIAALVVVFGGWIAERVRFGASDADAAARVERHFVILPFAAHWVGGEIALSEELAEAHWLKPDELGGLKTTEGLAEIVAAATERIALAQASAR